MDITFINQSHAITDQKVAQIAEACGLQLKNDVAAAWDIQHPIGVKTGSAPDNSSYPFFFVDTIPEAPGALAYHFVQDNGIPAGKIGVQTTLDAHELVETAASHEAVELQCDIFCASWSFSNRLSCLVATEACDPVQGDSYTVDIADGTKIPVSNFVTPAYFTDNALGNKVDYLGKLNETFAISSGGYQIRMKGGSVKQAWGAQAPAALREGKARSQGRTFWRAVTMAIAMQSG